MKGQAWVVVHGGAGHTEDHADGCAAAAESAMAMLAAGEGALAVAIAAATAMEDDPRFNAGTGSNLALDGETIEMSAGLMDAAGRLAAVMGIQRVKNPIRVAEALLATPLKALAGPGATAFARAAGFPDYDPLTEGAREQHREVVKALAAGTGGDFPQEWHAVDWRRLWNFERPWEEVLARYGHGTIGVVVADGAGGFAACASTGGSAPMPLGRVGDTPLVGCGFYAGPAGAIAATGVGEYVIQHQLCMRVYHWIEGGMPLEAALEGAIALIDPAIEVGLIAVSREGAASRANTRMPVAVRRG